MGRMVQLSDEAYSRLRNAKRKGESFSDVVNRLTTPAARGDKRMPLDWLVGTRSYEEGEAHLRMIRDIDELDRPGKA